MIAALEVPSDIDLRLFSRFLTQSGIQHRIVEEGVNQVVWVSGEHEREQVLRYYSQVSSGEVVLEDAAGNRTDQQTFARRLASNLIRYPVTMVLILLNVLLFPVTSGSLVELQYGLFANMTLLPFEWVAGELSFRPLAAGLQDGQWWRLLTPMFLHFGWMHIVFNLLWTWEIGRRIEMRSGSTTVLLVVLVASLTANLLQYVLYGPGLFGGMSGVVFGMLGYCMVWDRLVPAQRSGLAPGIYYFMLAFLALGFTGFLDMLALGSLANGAHLGGLLAGVVTGATAGMLSRLFDREA